MRVSLQVMGHGSHLSGITLATLRFAAHILNGFHHKKHKYLANDSTIAPFTILQCFCPLASA